MQEENYHPVITTQTFVTVILPMAIPKPYTYSVPEKLVESLQFGIRVEVQFGRNQAGKSGGKLYSALVIDIHQEPPKDHTPKEIISVIDEKPIVNPPQIKLWKWIADYYCCTLGEVMHAALPANLKLTSETSLLLSPLFDNNYSELTDKEYLIAEALSIQNEITIEDVRSILGQKTVYPLIKRMLEKKVLYLKEDLKSKYKPKKVACVRLQEPYASQPNRLDEAFEKLSRSNRQVETLMAYIQLSKKQEFIRRQDIYNLVDVDSNIIRAIVKKGNF